MTNELSNEDAMKKFVEEYGELSKKHGFQIIAQPLWKQSMDTGTFSLVINMTVVANPKESTQ